jgi:hypothetical protein
MHFEKRGTASLLLALGLALGSALGAAPCRADEPADRAAAEALFQLGQRLMKEGNYAEACSKLEASQKLDPGIGTLLFLGECEERIGRIASAWATFQEASALAKARGEADRAEIAELRAVALRPRLVYMQFEVAASNRVPGFELRRNGVPIAEGSFGVSLPSDSGSYQIEATAPARAPWRATVYVPAKLDAPLIVRVPSLANESVAPSGPLPSESSTKNAPPPEERETSSAQKTWALVTLGAGALAGVAGGVLALLAKNENDESKGLCRASDPNLCTPEGVEKRKDAKQLAEFATVFAIGGGVLAGTGVVLYLTAPSDSKGKTAGFGLRVSTRF